MLAPAGGHTGTAALPAGAVGPARAAPGPRTGTARTSATRTATAAHPARTENVVSARPRVRTVSAPGATATGERRCSHRSHRGRVSPHEVTASYNRPGRTEPHA